MQKKGEGGKLIRGKFCLIKKEFLSQRKGGDQKVKRRRMSRGQKRRGSDAAWTEGESNRQNGTHKSQKILYEDDNNSASG